MSDFSKNRVLALYKILIKNSDEQHSISMQDILDHMASEGYSCSEDNDRFKIFKLPYRLQNGIVIKQGYKSTSPIDKIINYRMFERKIQFSEEMINSKDIMEKKSALDFIIDALQYLISTKGDTRNEQYKALALSVSDNMDGKVYAVVKKELDELMKLSNEYFDVRHNDYLNAAKEKREPLNDSQFIEYLYNRAYSILYLLRLKS